MQWIFSTQSNTASTYIHFYNRQSRGLSIKVRTTAEIQKKVAIVGTTLFVKRSNKQRIAQRFGTAESDISVFQVLMTLLLTPNL